MFRIVLLSLVTFLMILSSLWAVLARWFQAPGGGAGRFGFPLLWLLGLVALLYWFWLGGSWWQSLLVYIALFALLLVWWGTIKSSNQRDWADDLAHITTGTVDGRQVRLDNVRNFHWRSQQDYDIGWESR